MLRRKMEDVNKNYMKCQQNFIKNNETRRKAKDHEVGGKKR